jgi:16S rRNA (uracil1498-N3)-methyltransferase
MEDRKKSHRFFTDFFASGTTAEIIDAALRHQIVRVLRLRPGETVVLCAGDGFEHVVRLTEVEATGVRGEIVETRAGREPRREVTLYCALLKKDNFELVVQKATEIGVRAIVPLITRRTVKLGYRTERLEAIAREAAEQSERVTTPRVEEPLEFEQALVRADGASKIFLDKTGGAWPVDAANEGAVALFIGPEGGWDETEIAQAKAAGCPAVSLGGLILRGETAAIVASHLACWPPCA